MSRRRSKQTGPGPNGVVTQPKKRRAKTQSLLILHFDANRLRRDGLHMGEAADFGAIVASLGLRAEVAVADANDTASVLRLLAESWRPAPEQAVGREAPSRDTAPRVGGICPALRWLTTK